METLFEHPRVTIREVPFNVDGKHVIVTSGTGKGVLVLPVSKYRGMTSVVMVRQYRPPIGDFTLELPRGGSKDLSPEEAIREMVEEMGVTPRSTRLLGTIRPDTGLLDTEVAIYAAFVNHEDVVKNLNHVDDESNGSVVWMPVGSALGMIKRGQITCGMTLAAMMLGGEAQVTDSIL